LTAEDQICGKVLVEMKKKRKAWFCCLLDLSSGVVSGASFCNVFYSFLMLQPLRWRCVECVIHHERMCAKNNSIYRWREQAIIEWLRSMISIVACCHSVTLCAHAARVFRSQQNGAVTRMWRSCRVQPSNISPQLHAKLWNCQATSCISFSTLRKLLVKIKNLHFSLRDVWKYLVLYVNKSLEQITFV